MSTILVVGASRGLGHAFVDGLGSAGDRIIGVSRHAPAPLPKRDGVSASWIEADFSEPQQATAKMLNDLTDDPLDTVIYNLGAWEERAFDNQYSFLSDRDDDIERVIATNVTAPYARVFVIAGSRSLPCNSDTSTQTMICL